MMRLEFFLWNLIFETTIKEASIITEKLNEDFHSVKMDKPYFAIVVDC